MTNETETKTKTRFNPQIWVGCLSAYNNGYLHGEWIDAAQEPEILKEAIQEILRTSPVSHFECCEEWIICDHNDFAGYSVGEYENIDKVSKVAIAIEKHGEAMGIYLGRQYDIENFVSVMNYSRSFYGHV
jgi:antirestriction protein